MRFLANENFPELSIKILRNEGFKIYSVVEETPGEKDINILKRAQNNNLVILTFDKDYGELIFQHKVYIPAGVIF